jgi:hypothetical protein
MSVPLVVENLNQVPTAWRSEYVRTPDGKFELDVIGPLKSALRRERRFHQAITRLAQHDPELRAIVSEVESAT